jgi:serine/threonine-protein kinase PknK
MSDGYAAPMPIPTARCAVLLAVGAALVAAGCGSSSSKSPAEPVSVSRPAQKNKPAAGPLSLHVVRTLSLPSAREGTATGLFSNRVYITGGISDAGTSTATVFRLDPSGSMRMTNSTPLPSPIHDAAAAEVNGRMLVFGGGQSEGSNRILELEPGPPKLIGTLPQALSDLDAATIGDRAYVAGGWNGSATNASIYAVPADGSVTIVGRLPLGVRYPAVAALDGRLIVAGGETSAGTPTTVVSAFDPATRRLTRLPDLPVPTDHGAGAVLDGRLFVIGGLRNGVFTDRIVSWAPGQTRWQTAGRLPAALADLAAVPFDGGVLVLGGRGSGGPVATVTLLRP